MQQRFGGSEKIGDIVSEFPGASHLFKEVHIDFCCGGDRTLAEAVRHKHLNEEEMVRRLNESYAAAMNRNVQEGADWRAAPTPELIDHIVNVHHAYLRKELPLLSEFVTKILRVHGSAHPEIPVLYKQFHQMKMELDQHLIAEEEVLFPLLVQYAERPTPELYERAMKGLHDLESDHSLVGDCLKEMRAVTDDYALPPDACKTYTLTYQKLAELESDLFQHIHLENNILFPRIKPSHE
ncbi:Iron-sulfur cluster repair protein YtfE [Paenibacillus solanacearum]|uniref:Iron-sulfur cluster repair protein YtfE n=1 Tax=Paenibacillus solanacearum TaxID=2048548 RepID=A0A916K401_9BACL|nr:iron-sulfur cluster repair di-iron protein [Paenibacillus solanacearum]CAG7641711.1 Iron-sulfur cluster repair protein YtfE [Paenibacillus solanacearum]